MGNTLKLAGQRFGRLSVIKRIGKDRWGHMLWECVCECGTIKNIRGGALKYSNTKSCGCFKKEFAVELSTTHGMSFSPEYRVWRSMIQRCKNKNGVGYKNYGGRGTTSVD